MEASTSACYGSTSACFLGKRNNPEDPGSCDEPLLKSSRETTINYYVLDSESPLPTDEDTETIYSAQDKTTASPRDTSDLPTTDDESQITSTALSIRRGGVPVEYEPVSASDTESLLQKFLTSASDSETATQMLSKVSSDSQVLITIHSEFDYTDDEDTWADSSSISSERHPDEMDPELSLTDYWSCIRCKTKNNNPMYRYCEKCFKVRKSFFPPRPKAMKKKRKQKKERRKRRRNSKNSNSINNNNSNNGKNNTNELNNGASTSGVSSVPFIISSVNSSSCSSYNSNSNNNNNDDNNNSGSFQPCQICMTRPKDGVFVHGRNRGHMYCCYQCTKKVWRDTGKCPLCNCKVNQIIKVIS